MERLIAWQENLLQMIQNQGYDTKTLQEKLKSMMEQNEKLRQEHLLELITYYIQEEECTFERSIYTEKNMGVESLIEKSLLLYRGYRKGVDLLEEDIDEYILKD